MFELDLPLWGDIGLFLAAAAVIGVAGVRTASFADRLADRTGLGEALTGTIFLGLITALPGLVASILAAYEGHASLAIGNAIGGIAVQTAALAVADIAYRKANLEHAAASATNLIQTVMLVFLLTLALGGMTGPEVTAFHVHPTTIALFVAAGFAFLLAYRTSKQPMWQPTQTAETVEDEPQPEGANESLAKLAVGLVITAGLTAAAGALVAETAANLVEDSGIPEAVVGGLFMALATSLPELVTSVAAVRRGALTLAVSDIVGGNFFDILFVAAADLAYVEGSLYHGEGVGNRELFLTTLTILLNVILLAGLLYRQEKGPARIGFESVLLLALYIGGFAVMSLTME